MKKLLFIVSICCSYLAEAQPYQSIFGKNSTWWRVEESCNVSGSLPILLNVTADTTIFGTKYYKIESHSFTNGKPFFLREDTSAGKVWYYNPNFSLTEKLYMDLNLKVGDSFNFLTNSIIIVDSVYFHNVRKHIRFDFTYAFSQKVEFIEGIGCNAGVKVIGLDSNCNDFLLLCKGHDQKVYYVNPLSSDSCSSVSLTPNKLSQNLYTVFPNPSAGYIYIPNFKQLKRYVIFNILGNAVLKGDITNVLVLKDLKPGTYILKLIGINGEANTQVISVI